MKETIVFFDLETGGTEPKHPDIQLAAVAVRDWKEVASFERKIKFDPAVCDPEALRINHYTPEAWEKALPAETVAREFKAFLQDHADTRLISKVGNSYYTARLAGHNVASFDCPRLRTFMDSGLNGKFWPGCWWYPIDTYPIAIWYCVMKGIRSQDYQLQTLAKLFGIEAQGVAHEALADVRLAVRLAEFITRNSFGANAVAVDVPVTVE